MLLREAPAGVLLRVLRYRAPPRGGSWARPARVVSLVEDWENWDRYVHEGDRIRVVDPTRDLVEVVSPDGVGRIGQLVTYSECVRAGGDHYELTEVELCGPNWN